MVERFRSGSSLVLAKRKIEPQLARTGAKFDLKVVAKLRKEGVLSGLVNMGGGAIREIPKDEVLKKTIADLLPVSRTTQKWKTRLLLSSPR